MNAHAGEAVPADGARWRLQSRRVRRLEETQEIQVRTTHRRRKVLTRTGVLAGFGMAMVVYPIMGTIAPYDAALESLPGVVLGEAPTTAHALLGEGPQLNPSDLPLPTLDEQAQAIATSDRYTVSQHLPSCDGDGTWSGSNGQLTSDSLCKLWNGEMLRADAAVALAELNARFKLQFGRNICVSQGYRTLSEQYAIKRKKGYLAATPGKSMHGWAIAIDLCNGDSRGEAKRWLDENGGAFGWVNPDWARNRIYEPWHFEYEPGTDALGVYDHTGYWASDGGDVATGEVSETVKPKEPETPETKDPEPVVTPAPQPSPEA